MAGGPQPRNRLGKRRSKDDALPTYMRKKKVGSGRKESKKNRKG